MPAACPKELGLIHHSVSSQWGCCHCQRGRQKEVPGAFGSWRAEAAPDLDNTQLLSFLSPGQLKIGIPPRSLQGGQGTNQLKEGVHSTPRQGASYGLVSADVEALGKMVP